MRSIWVRCPWTQSQKKSEKVMDPKAKIEEMLRLKREGARVEKPREPEQPKQPMQPLPNEQHGTVMDRINSMLKQKQAQTVEPTPTAVVPPVATQPPEEVAAIVQRPPEVDLQSTD